MIMIDKGNDLNFVLILASTLLNKAFETRRNTILYVRYLKYKIQYYIAIDSLQLFVHNYRHCHGV